MPAWLALFTLALSCLLVGWLGVRQFGRPLPHLLEMLVASFALGTATVGWLAFLMAELGLFSLSRLAVLWLILVVLLLVSWRLRPATHGDALQEPEAPSMLLPPFLSGRVEALVLVFWSVAALWLFLRPHEYVLGAADAGVYVNLSASIAGTGGIAVPEALLADVTEETGQLFARRLESEAVAPYILFPGFYLFDVPASELTPQFYHLHPVWQAIAFSLGGTLEEGIRAALMMTGLWAFWGAAAVYLTVRQVAGWQIAMLALAGLTLNALQIWFARYPTTEAMSQFYLWAGFWATGAWLGGRAPQRLWALLGGLSFGLFFLVRIDAIMVVPLLLLLALWSVLNARYRKTAIWYFLPLSFLLLHSLVHGYWQSRPYFLDLYGFAFHLIRRDWWLSLVALAAGGAVLWLIVRVRGPLERLQRLQPWLLGALTAAFLLFALYGWLVRPVIATGSLWLDPYSSSAIPVLDHENWLRLAWYLSPLGVGLGVAGISLLIWRAERRTALWIGAGLLFSLFFLWSIRANPHQIYAMRRYVPAVLPFFVIGGAYAIGWLGTQRARWLSAIALIVAAVWLAGFAWNARGFVQQIDYDGILLQLAQLDAQFEPGAILIFDDEQAITQGDIVGTPLRFLFGRQVLSLREPAVEQLPLLQATLDRWLEEGRAVYWLQTSSAQAAVTPERMEYIGPYQVEANYLEMTYTHRPQAIATAVWAGDIYRLVRRQPDG
jgi:hypothetical protein